MRRSKAAVLGPTALALLVTSALLISGAQGNPSNPNPHTPKITHHFQCVKTDHATLEPNCTSHGEEVKVHRSHPNNVFPSIHEFTTALGAMKCANVTFTGHIDADGTSATWPTTPDYSECTAIGNPAVFNTNGCHYEFNIEETIETASPPAGYDKTEGKGSSALVCPEGKAMTVTFEGLFGGECHVEYKPQKTITPIYFRNKASGTTDLTVEWATATRIANFKGGLFNCGANGNVHTTYTGNTTFIGQVSNGAGGHTQVNLRFEDGKAHG